VLRAVVLTQYRRVTDRQTDGRTDGIAVASTALAMRALRHAVKTRLQSRLAPPLSLAPEPIFTLLLSDEATTK